MLSKFMKFWKIHGQATGFLILLVILNTYWILLENEMRTNSWVSLGWLVLFFGGATFLGLQGQKHGWRLPKNIKDTH